MSFQSLKAVTSSIWNDMEGGLGTDDTRINQRMVRDRVLKKRANLLGRLLSRYIGNIPGGYFNTCCLPLSCEEVCPGSKERVWRVQLPPLVGQLGKRSVRYLGTVDGKQSFEWLDEPPTDNRASYVPFDITANQPSYVVYGTTAELFNKPTRTLKMLRFVGVIADPFFCNKCEDDIMIPIDHISDIEKEVKLDLANFLVQRKVDKMNNNNPDN